MFTSLWFLALFAAIVCVWYSVPPPRRWLAALLGSAVFYLALEPFGILLLGASALATWQCALRIHRVGDAADAAAPPLQREARRALRAKTQAVQRRWLALGVAASLAPLALLKYIGSWAGWQLWVPLGISYYSLQLIGYLVDVYRTVIPAEKNYGKVLCYGMFFLSITQGPFNRYGSLMPQLEQPLPFDRQRAAFGLQKMAWGYFQKLAVADRAAVVVGEVYKNYANMDRSQLLFGMLMFGVQLYADFSGYTNIALGAGEVLGLSLPDNFRQPFFSRSISEFWQRWHITLGAWLKDYVFYPVLKSRALLGLGKWLKTRVGKKLARSIPTWAGMMMLWFAIGLWHGSAFKYLFGTGILQFLYIFCGELAEPLFARLRRICRVQRWPNLFRALQALRTTCLMLVAWVFFRADSFGQAVDYLRCVLVNPGHRVFSNYWELGITNRFGMVMLMLGVLALLAVDVAHARGRALRAGLAGKSLPVRWACYQAAIWAFALMGVFLSSGTETFLYARF